MSEPGSSLSSAAESMRLMFIQRPTMSSRDIVDTFGFHGFEMVRELRARNIVEKCGGVEDDLAFVGGQKNHLRADHARGRDEAFGLVLRPI